MNVIEHILKKERKTRLTIKEVTKQGLISDIQRLVIDMKTKLFDINCFLHVTIITRYVLLYILDVRHGAVIDRSLMISKNLKLQFYEISFCCLITFIVLISCSLFGHAVHCKLLLDLYSRISYFFSLDYCLSCCLQYLYLLYLV